MFPSAETTKTTAAGSPQATPVGIAARHSKIGTMEMRNVRIVFPASVEKKSVKFTKHPLKLYLTFSACSFYYTSVF